MKRSNGERTSSHKEASSGRVRRAMRSIDVIDIEYEPEHLWHTATLNLQNAIGQSNCPGPLAGTHVEAKRSS
jgi:hypothetical protein